MRYVKIKAKTYNEAMMKLKMEQGDDAIPISHKYVKEGGLLKSKFFAKELVELTAAIPERKTLLRSKPEAKSGIDYTIGDSSENGVNNINSMQAKPVAKNQNTDSNGEIDLIFNRNNTAKKPVEPQKAEEKEQGGERNVNLSGNEPLKRLEKEFDEIKHTLNRVLDQKSDSCSKSEQIPAEDDHAIKPFMDILVQNDFDSSDCRIIIEEMKNSVSKDDLKDKYKIEKTFKELLKSRIVTSGPIKKGNRKKVIMFIGPTGVGKTTSLAKLGAILSLREGYRVAFVTIDTYRIAATEQLKKYAEIIKIPIHVVSNQEAFKDVLENEKADIILVDTSGRSHKNELKISEIKSFSDEIEYDCEKYLCVSANMKRSDLDNVFKSFDKIKIDSVIVTKLDETSSIGNIIEIAEKHGKPISYITNGQEVPNDIDVASADKLVNIIVGAVS